MTNPKIAIIIFLLGLLSVILVSPPPAHGACIMSYCKKGASERTYIRNSWEQGRQIIGDLYAPTGGGRIQIRNKHRQIIGYIESDGSVTNVTRQKKGQIDER